MDLKEIGFEGTDWIHLVLDRNQWWALVKNSKEPSGSIMGGIS
jgi:hypothetical protein